MGLIRLANNGGKTASLKGVCQFRHSLLEPMWIPSEKTLVKSEGLNPRMTLLAWG